MKESNLAKKLFKLTGNTEAVEKASQIIDRIVHKIQDYEQGKGKGKDRKDTEVAGKGKGKGKKQLNHEPGEPCGATVANGSTSDAVQIKQVPDEYAGRVIGRNGASIHEILRESGAKIDSRANEETEPGKTAFKLTGNTEAVEKTSQMIDQIAQRARASDQNQSKGANQGKGKGKDRKDFGKGNLKGNGNFWQYSTAPTWIPKAGQ